MAKRALQFLETLRGLYNVGNIAMVFQSGPNSLVKVNDQVLPSAAVRRVGLFRGWWLIR